MWKDDIRLETTLTGQKVEEPRLSFTMPRDPFRAAVSGGILDWLEWVVRNRRRKASPQPVQTPSSPISQPVQTPSSPIHVQAPPPIQEVEADPVALTKSEMMRLLEEGGKGWMTYRVQGLDPSFIEDTLREFEREGLDEDEAVQASASLLLMELGMMTQDEIEGLLR